MDKGDWGVLGGSGLIGSLVAALSVLLVRRKSSEDGFANTQNQTAAQAIVQLRADHSNALQLIDKLRTDLAKADHKANQMEMHLHDWMHRNKVLKRDMAKLAAIVKTSPRAEVLDWIEHSSFAPPDF